MSLNNPFNPKRFRKYHERAETYLTSISGVAISRCNIALKPYVSGNGNLTTIVNVGCQAIIVSDQLTPMYALSDDAGLLSTNPEKKIFIHCIINIFGTIITACFFIPSIIPSI